jgi:hypothetical protein
LTSADPRGISPGLKRRESAALILGGLARAHSGVAA